MRLRVAPLALAGLLSLACLNAWLVRLALENLAPESQASMMTPAQVPTPPAFEVKLPKAKPITAHAQTLARPVFFRSRQPYVPPPPPPQAPPKPVAAPPPVPVDPGFVLGGVAITEAGRKAYIFNKTDAARGAWLTEGETVQGWKVEAIDAGSAKLQQRGRSIDLQLYPKR
jgi:hypothetical protein